MMYSTWEYVNTYRHAACTTVSITSKTSPAQPAKAVINIVPVP